MSRYDTIIDLINIFKPISIVETGTWRGSNAARMIQAAQRHNSGISYTGYDLFEDATPETDATEFNVKPHPGKKTVEDYLAQTVGASVVLIKGNTRQTLKNFTADFAFIDGGHSLETIEHDYQALKHCSVIIFDDVYVPDEKGGMPDISKVGANKVIEKLPHAVIRSNDRVEGGGIVCLGVVFGGGL